MKHLDLRFWVFFPSFISLKWVIKRSYSCFYTKSFQRGNFCHYSQAGTLLVCFLGAQTTTVRSLEIPIRCRKIFQWTRAQRHRHKYCLINQTSFHLATNTVANAALMHKSRAVMYKRVVHLIKAYSHCSSSSWRVTEAASTIHSDSPVWNSIWNRATAAEKTAELGFVWRTVKSKHISKLKQWKTVFVESFCPYFKNTKLWKIELEDRYVLKKPLILIWSTAFITIRKATLSPVFIPKLDEIWKSWSSNEVLGREKQMKKRGQGSVEDNLHQLKQWHFNLHSEQKFLHTVHAIHLIRVCYANSEKCRDLIAMF